MKVLLYGILADVVGRQVEVDVENDCSIADLREMLGRDYPTAATELVRSRAIIDMAAVSDDYRAAPTDKVEFLPPVSGG